VQTSAQYIGLQEPHDNVTHFDTMTHITAIIYNANNNLTFCATFTFYLFMSKDGKEYNL